MILLRLLNLVFLLGLVVCIAAAMSGLILLAPLMAGGWLLTLFAIVGSEPEPRTPKTQPSPETAGASQNTALRSLPAVERVPARAS
jgi:hypothetical protein